MRGLGGPQRDPSAPTSHTKFRLKFVRSLNTVVRNVEPMTFGVKSRKVVETARVPIRDLDTARHQFPVSVFRVTDGNSHKRMPGGGRHEKIQQKLPREEPLGDTRSIREGKMESRLNWILMTYRPSTSDSPKSFSRAKFNLDGGNNLGI
jgi:hypothetical protein